MVFAEIKTKPLIFKIDLNFINIADIFLAT